MSAPGGFIFVTTGLIKACKSEDELAAVIAHELAHVARKHGLKTIKAARLTQAFTLLAQQAATVKQSDANTLKLTDLFGGSVDDVAKSVVVTGYGRDNEYEADRVGRQFLQRANYDPGALSAFIQETDASGKKGGLLKTHPPAKKRVKELAKSKVEPSEDYQDSEARKKRFAAALAKL
jgi:predicted Zn-dependent protease